ncbi:hypothetical protein [Pyrinomonas methylaliphatogenes]|jgi:hypothetical protein|uniref:Uncharacterized protein n=1 Tax=Pyrinomonas methylaliphatogenes TaxID=454194 RepID=A0A0B6WWT0_9BACT|nr:hypothetical protein [Pyrinomonas methylaliphatogenes]MBX5479224.1 hypothetical protein [Pyrinomonas methylaliphatogenes]CDM64580.1 hypothetical protein PYK22_00574 [Pyrinomonas methylaliphatogenes]
MTQTPPPYFPQNPLSPPDPNYYRKVKIAFFSCLALVVLLAIGGIIGAIYLIARWL